jgi:lysophospholipase L1-like esterase
MTTDSRRRALLRFALAALPVPLLFAAAESGYRLSLRREARDLGALRRSEAFELYAVGDSTAWGEPYGVEANIAALAARRFGGRFAGRPIEPIVLAQRGGTTFSQLYELRKAMPPRDRRLPAAVLIYCAHNDRAIFDTPAPPLPVRLLAALTRFSFLISELRIRLEKDRVIAPHSDLAAYEANLTAMLDAVRDAGAVAILATSVSNQADIDPRLYPAEGLSDGQTLELLAQGERLEARDGGQAVDFYRAAAARNPRFAPYAKYRLGRAYSGIGRYEEARLSFTEASEEDHGDNFGRATRAQNEIVRRLARERGLPLVDAAVIFEKAAPHGLLGLNLFSDGHHPNMDGRVLLAEGFAQALSMRFDERESPVHGGPRAAEAELGLDARRLSEADAYSAKWWLYSAARHLPADVRLAGARHYFDAALALDPNNFSAWLGRGLLEFERARGWLSDDRELAWFRGHGFQVFVTDDYRGLSEVTLRELLEKMRKNGVSAATLAGIERTAGGDTGLLARRGMR